MQELHLTLDDGVYGVVVDFLQKLPKHSVQIHSPIDPPSPKVDLGQFCITGFKTIDDPVAWQNRQREWHY